MTEQEERELLEWMQANRNEYLMLCAKELKEYCGGRECKSCIFYSQEECRISNENPFGRTVPPEDWEV